MQIFEQEMSWLRRAIRYCLERIGWRNSAPAAAIVPAPQLASDDRSPADIVSSILDRTATDLRNLSSAEDGDLDAGPIIERAVRELGQLGFQSPPFEDAIMDRYLEDLPDTDYRILRHFKQGMKHSDIAALLGTDLDSVRHSLVKTYAELRMQLIGSNDDDSELQLETPIRSKSLGKPMNLTSVHHN